MTSILGQIGLSNDNRACLLVANHAVRTVLKCSCGLVTFQRNLFLAGEFIEVFMETPLAPCEARDPQGPCRKARGAAPYGADLL